jgi:hypothetical protein
MRRRLLGLVGLTIAISGCAVPMQNAPEVVNDSTVRLSGAVHTTRGGDVHYRWEIYDRNDFGFSTPPGTTTLEPKTTGPVSAEIDFLEGGATYRTRLCANDADQTTATSVACTEFRTFQMAGDSVNGGGTIHFPTGTGPGRIVAEVDFQDVHSGSSGENPAGIVRMVGQSGGSAINFDVTCLNVAGTQFTVGIEADGAEPSFRYFDVTNEGFETARTEPLDGRDPANCPAPATGLPGDYNFVPGDAFELRDSP